MRPSLLPQTYDKIIERDQSSARLPEGLAVELKIIALGEAYRGAENSVAFYSLKLADKRAADISRQSAARFRVQLHELLAQLVIP